MDGRPRCLIVVVVVVCSYVLAILSAVHFAGATYLLTYGFVEIYFIAELALVIFSTVLSVFYLGLQTFLALRYQRIRRHDPRKRASNDACLTLLAFVTLVWLTAFIFGLTIAIKSIDGVWGQTRGLRESHDASKFRELGFAGPLLAFIFAGFLLCASWISDSPFRASLCGIHSTSNEVEDEDQLSRKLFIAEVDKGSFEQPGTRSQEPDFSPQWTFQSATPRARAPPLPPLQCQLPTESGQHIPSYPYPTPSRSHMDGYMCSPTLPSPIFFTKTTHSRQPSSSSPISYLSRSSATHSPLSPVSMTKTPRIPKIPEKYRSRPSYDSRDDGTPTRPSSRPSMPPAAFWRFAAEQQVSSVSEGGLQSWQLHNNTKTLEPPVGRYPIIVRSQEQSILGNTHSNNRAARSQSCNVATTGILNDPNDGESGPGFDREQQPQSRERQMRIDRRERGRRTQSRRLTKRRQPWDTEPRRKSWNWI